LETVGSAWHDAPMKWNVEVAAPHHVPDLDGYPVQIGPFEANSKSDADLKAGRLIRAQQPRLDLNARVTIRAEDGSTVHEISPTVDTFIPAVDMDKHPRAP
jgi:hypothetical protein